MGKTDNTRPWELQGADPTVLGRVVHRHVKRHIQFDGVRCIEWYELLECDYTPDNNLHDYRVSHVAGELARAKGIDFTQCFRKPRYFGGMNYNGGATKEERKYRRRSIRQRERHALYKAQWGEGHEFDLLPIRKDARTVREDTDLS